MTSASGPSPVASQELHCDGGRPDFGQLRAPGLQAPEPARRLLLLVGSGFGRGAETRFRLVRLRLALEETVRRYVQRHPMPHAMPDYEVQVTTMRSLG
jgi:hypothetical protein